MEIVSRNIKNKGVTERIGMTLLLLVLSRLGTFIPIPGVDHDAFYQSISTNPIVSFLNVFFWWRVCINWHFCFGNSTLHKCLNCDAISNDFNT